MIKKTSLTFGKMSPTECMKMEKELDAVLGLYFLLLKFATHVRHAIGIAEYLWNSNRGVIVSELSSERWVTVETAISNAHRMSTFIRMSPIVDQVIMECTWFKSNQMNLGTLQFCAFGGDIACNYYIDPYPFKESKSRAIRIVT